MPKTSRPEAHYEGEGPDLAHLQESAAKWGELDGVGKLTTTAEQRKGIVTALHRFALATMGTTTARSAKADAIKRPIEAVLGDATSLCVSLGELLSHGARRKTDGQDEVARERAAQERTAAHEIARNLMHKAPPSLDLDRLQDLMAELIRTAESALADATGDAGRATNEALRDLVDQLEGIYRDATGKHLSGEITNHKDKTYGPSVRWVARLVREVSATDQVSETEIASQVRTLRKSLP